MKDFFNSVSKFFKADPNALDGGGHTRLQRAVVSNDLKQVKSLLKDGADLNSRGTLLYPPLHLALKKDRQPIALSLIEAGANVNLQDALGWTPLHHAVDQSHEALILMLLKMGADPNIKNNKGETPLHLVSTANPQVIDILAKYKADMNVQDERGNTPLHRFLDKQPMAERLLAHDADPNVRNGKDISPYMMMLEDGRLQHYPGMLQKMIALKADLGTKNPLGETILHLAARLEMEETFLNIVGGGELSVKDAGGNNVLHALVRTQNARMIARVLERSPGLVNELNNKGYTPLAELMRRLDHPVAKLDSRFKSVVYMLLSQKADPDTKDEKGRGLLHLAVLHEKPEFLREVLSRGADPNLADREGRTALHYAIEKRSVEAMDALLDHDADPDLTDAKGWTILDRMAEKGDRDSSLVQRLIVAGGQYKKQLPLHPEMMRRPKQLEKSRPAGPKP